MMAMYLKNIPTNCSPDGTIYDCKLGDDDEDFTRWLVNKEGN